jgi:hypothetical protein
MEIGLGRPAMTDMLTEYEAVLFGLLDDGLSDLDDCSLEWPTPDSTAALATEPASSPQLASRGAEQSVDLASPRPTANVPRQARPAGHGGVGYDMCMLNSTYRLMGPCHTKLVGTPLSSYDAEDKESDYAHTIWHVERLTGEEFVLQPPDDPANGSKKRSRLRESERRSPEGVNRFPFHLSQNRLCDEHRPLKRWRSPAAASIIAQSRVVPAMPCAPIPILSAVPLGFAFVGAHGGGGVGGGTLCCGTPDGVALGGTTPVHAFGGGALSFGTSGGDALDSATPARAFGGCGGAFSGSMRGGHALDGEHREQCARSMEQPCLLETWLERIKDGYSRFAVAFDAAGVEDSDDLKRMDLSIYCKVEAALTQMCDAKPMHLKNIRLAIELLCGCGLEVPVHTKQPCTEAASALAQSAPNPRPAKRDAKEPAACLRVVCLSGHEMAYQVFKPTMNERHLNCDGEGCDAKIASGKYGWTCHTCHDFDLCDACADPSGRGRRSWSRRSSNRPQSPR